VALELLDEIDPKKELMYEVETRVGFGDLLPDVFGSTDLVGRIGDRAIVLDWKFGDGVVVTAEENEQLMFYAAAAMRTAETAWAFEGANEIELIIVQPPMIKRWVTTKERVKQFERELVKAVTAAQQPDAKIQHGEHCRWCAAKPICPKMTGAVDRALVTQIKEIDVDTLGRYLKNADLLEDWIKDLRGLAMQILEKNLPVPGYKLVQKRGQRQWVDEAKAAKAMLALNVPRHEIYKEELLSPAQAEKVLKKSKESKVCNSQHSLKQTFPQFPHCPTLCAASLLMLVLLVASPSSRWTRAVIGSLAQSRPKSNLIRHGPSTPSLSSTASSPGVTAKCSVRR
jgi:hypothetical protein